MTLDTSHKLVGTQLTKKYGTRTVLNDVSLEITPGEIVGLLGPNGAGKTTTFKLFLGLEKPSSGTVSLNEPLNGLPLYKRAKLGLGYLPQTPSVFVNLSVEENLIAILKTLRHPSATKEATLLLKQFNLHHLRTQKARTLSGGERRKLEFARALCSKPKMLLIDEPFAAVDPIFAQELAKLIVQLSTQNIGILLTDHSVKKSLSICSRIYILVNGEILEEGTSDDIQQSERAKQLYLGNDN